MGAITDLWKSERGLLTVLILIAATVLTAVGKMPMESWEDYSKFIFVTYVSGKTLTGVMQIAKGGTADPEAAATAPAPKVSTLVMGSSSTTPTAEVK